MKTCYLYDKNTYEYDGESYADLDPLELENNIEKYLMPENSTFIEPLKDKKNYTVIFDRNKNKWKYKKIKKKDNEKNEYFTMEEQNIIFKIMDLRSYLYKTDWYVTRKLETGKEIPEDILNKRKEVREEISELIKENENLKQYL